MPSDAQLGLGDRPRCATLSEPRSGIDAQWLRMQAEVAAAEGALNKLGGTLLGVDLVQSYSSEGQRTAVVVRKNGVTPQKYPRAPGTPNKSPL
jgi:hypothetical protein